MFDVETLVIIECNCLHLDARQDCELEAHERQGHFEGIGLDIPRRPSCFRRNDISYLCYPSLKTFHD